MPNPPHLILIRMMKVGVENFLSRWETDLYWGPSGYPINVMEVLDTKCVRWPGETLGIDHNASFQIVDDTYLEEGEYDEFLADPTHFLMTKVWPKKHAKLA